MNTGTTPRKPSRKTPGKFSDLFTTGERFFGRLGAVVAGLILMVAGIGLGVSVVLLPLGIPLGLVGLALFLGGLFTPAFRRPD